MPSVDRCDVNTAYRRVIPRGRPLGVPLVCTASSNPPSARPRTRAFAQTWMHSHRGRSLCLFQVTASVSSTTARRARGGPTLQSRFSKRFFSHPNSSVAAPRARARRRSPNVAARAKTKAARYNTSTPPGASIYLNRTLVREGRTGRTIRGLHAVPKRPRPRTKTCAQQPVSLPLELRRYRASVTGSISAVWRPVEPGMNEVGGSRRSCIPYIFAPSAGVQCVVLTPNATAEIACANGPAWVSL